MVSYVRTSGKSAALQHASTILHFAFLSIFDWRNCKLLQISSDKCTQNQPSLVPQQIVHLKSEPWGRGADSSCGLCLCVDLIQLFHCCLVPVGSPNIGLHQPCACHEYNLVQSLNIVSLRVVVELCIMSQYRADELCDRDS